LINLNQPQSASISIQQHRAALGSVDQRRSASIIVPPSKSVNFNRTQSRRPNSIEINRDEWE
jgi:hypothetical protein